MKLQSTVLFTIVISHVAMLVGIGCDGSDLRSIDSVDAPTRDARERQAPRRLPESDVSKIRSRADLAFTRSTGVPTRFETRIGPQPWPQNLPQGWPEPRRATLVADTTIGERRHEQKPTEAREDGRLLLIDLPDPLNRALDSYRGTLRRNGFELAPKATGQGSNAFLVKRGTLEARLSFFARKHATRLEILFLSGTSVGEPG